MFAEDDINADWTGAQIGNNDSEFLNLANLIYLTWFPLNRQWRYQERRFDQGRFTNIIVTLTDIPKVHNLSGPIAIEGAEPGDCLVVDILDGPYFLN